MQDNASNGAGYGTPPKATQFQKGGSGNPKGRPRGSKNIATLIAQAAYDKITVTTKNGEKRKLSRVQAAILQLANKAAQGDDKAMLRYIEMVDDVEQRAAAARPPETPMGEKDLAVLHEVYKRLQDCILDQSRPLAGEAQR